MDRTIVILPAGNSKLLHQMLVKARKKYHGNVSFRLTDEKVIPEAPTHWCEIVESGGIKLRDHILNLKVSDLQLEQDQLEFKTEEEALNYLHSIRMPGTVTGTLGVYQCKSHWHLGIKQ